MTPNWKPSRTARIKAKKQAVLTRTKGERDNKADAKRRDGYRCRFPQCGCRRLGLALDARLESAHGKHKGMGGDPKMLRSETSNLITVCKHRHQDGPISFHKGTLQAHPRIPSDGFDGPVSWFIDFGLFKQIEEDLPTEKVLKAMAAIKVAALSGRKWVRVAHEEKVQQLAPLEPWQRLVLVKLAEMDL